MHFGRRVAGIVAVAAAEAAALVVLARLGRLPRFPDDAGRWLETTEPADALASLVRWLALGAAAWLATSNGFYALARLSGARRTALAVGALAPPAARRVVDRAVAVALTGTLTLPVSSAAVALVVPSTGVRDGRAPAAVSTAPAATLGKPAAVIITPPPVTAAPASVVVAAGDSLWSITAAHLAAATGRTPDALGVAEIAQAWVGVCDANRGSVRSGNVNVIYPGEVVLVPLPD